VRNNSVVDNAGHSFSGCCLPNMRTSAKNPIKFELTTVQGHPTSVILVLIESAYATSYWSLIVTLVLSCTVYEIRRLIGSYSFGTPGPYVSFGISRVKLTVRKLESWGYSCMILTSAVFD